MGRPRNASKSLSPSEIYNGDMNSILEKSSKTLGQNNDSDTGRIELQKNITLLNGITIIVGCIIGSGIFISPTDVVRFSGGNVGISLIVWLACGLISILGALCYAELGTTITRSGGEYVYLMEVMGPLPAFLFLWVNLVVSRPVVTAIICWAFGYYIAQIFFCEPDPENLNHVAKLIAAFGLLFIGFINCVSVKLAMKLQDIFTISKLFALALIIALGIWKMFETKGREFQNMFSTPFSYRLLPAALFSGLFSYGGWNNLNYVIEELKNPNRNLPLSIIIGMPLVTIVYIMTNVAYFAVLTPAEVESSVAVAFDFMNSIFPKISWVMPVFVSLSALGSVNGILFTSGRIIYSGARNGQLPKLFAMIHITKCTPVPSIILLCIISLMFLLGKDITTLIGYFNFTLFVFVGMCIGCVIYLRIKRPEMSRPIKLNIFLHVLFMGICIFFVIVPIINNPVETAIGIAIILTGIPVYYIFIKYELKTKNCIAQGRAIEVFFQKLLMVVSPDKDL